MDTFLATIVDKSSVNTNGSIVERFIKPRSSTIFGQLEYSLDVPGQPIEVSDPHEEFFNSAFGIWMVGNVFRWNMQANQYARSMEGYRTKESYSGTSSKP